MDKVMISPAHPSRPHAHTQGLLILSSVSYLELLIIAHHRGLINFKTNRIHPQKSSVLTSHSPCLSVIDLKIKINMLNIKSSCSAAV